MNKFLNLILGTTDIPTYIAGLSYQLLVSIHSRLIVLNK